MFERFTERARQVVVLAQEEARTLKHDYIGTEHLLLGLLRERDGIAAGALESFEVTLERVRGEVVRLVGVGDANGTGQIPFTEGGKLVLEQALREALGLGHTFVGTEHILLGLLSLDDGTSRRILLDCHADANRIRGEVIRRLSTSEPGPGHVALPGALTEPDATGSGFEEWIRVGPGAGVRRLLMIAAARALDDGREDIQPRDVLLALTRDEQAGPLLAELGVDDVGIQRALERRRSAGSPRASGES